MLLQYLIYIFNISYSNTWPKFDCALLPFFPFSPFLLQTYIHAVSQISLHLLSFEFSHPLPKSCIECKRLTEVISFKLSMVNCQGNNGFVKIFITFKKIILKARGIHKIRPNGEGECHIHHSDSSKYLL